MPDSTYSWWNDFKNNLNIELEKTVKDKNVVRNRSSSQYDRSL